MITPPTSPIGSLLAQSVDYAVDMSLLVAVILVAWATAADAVVIAPPWGDVRINPCARVSWQYLYWIPDGKCYPIFKQGPCPPTHELVFDPEERKAKCQCPSDRIFWAGDQRCYEPFTTGPCPAGSFLHPGKEISWRAHRPEPHRRTLLQVQAWLSQNDAAKVEPLGIVHCKERGSCPPGWAFWPATELCYPLNTQGPCHSGSLFYWSRRNGAQCGCVEEELRHFYWPVSATCHEHFSQGPCKQGQVFIYNNVSQTTQCSCSARLRHFHADTGQCFEKFTRGPCSTGQWLTSRPDEVPEYSMPASSQWKESGFEMKAHWRNSADARDSDQEPLTCSCLPGHAYSPRHDQCWREFTQGPCKHGYFFSPGKDRTGICFKNPCTRNELYFPEIQRCYRTYSRGPCGSGQVVVSDDQHGIGYRGRCGCSSTHISNYWPEEGKCYQLETTGPCTPPLVFSIRSADDLSPRCSCPVNQVFHNESRQCYREYTQGWCEWNEWLVPRSLSPDQFLDAQDRSFESAVEYVCQCKPGYEYQPGSTFCQPPSVELLKSLNNGSKRRTAVQGSQLHRGRSHPSSTGSE